MNRVVVEPPAVAGNAVTYRWRVEPASRLYRTTSFQLEFPESLDISRVSQSTWAFIGLACLHPHWVLLRPCLVELPFALSGFEGRLWRRLLEIAAETLEGHRTSGEAPGGGVELVSGTARLAPHLEARELGRCALAFSGGKDSLLHAGLLAEFSPAPILVTTTSPLPPLYDHATARRRQVLREVAARDEFTFVEVHSDFRSSWDNDFAGLQGIPIAVNELTDTFLYFGAALAAGEVLGATHFFVASETEVQESVERSGRIVQHKHFMYSAVTQRALSALLAPAGIRLGSLTYPLRSSQVEELLWTRYPELAGLQYSCWRVGPDEAACSRCGQCLRMAFTALAAEESPSRVGLDLTTLLLANRDFRPRDADPATSLPGDIVARDLHRQTIRRLARTPLSRVARELSAGSPARALSFRRLAALRAFSRLKARFAADIPPEPGFRDGFLPLVDPLFRDRVEKIYAARFPREAPSDQAGVLSRSEALTRRLLSLEEGTA